MEISIYQSLVATIKLPAQVNLHVTNMYSVYYVHDVHVYM
jgi:hypothetical protein